MDFFEQVINNYSGLSTATKPTVAAGNYGYFVNINIVDMMPPYGIKLDKGTKQKMSILIRDDCSDADLFNCQAFGFERVE